MANSKNQSLDKVSKEVQNCKECSLHKNCKNTVFSKGNINSKIMLIGEAPGKNENEKGLPFVGKSGQHLNKLLTQAGFNIEKDIYFCNVVKCRPVKNNRDRKPTAEEIMTCKKYLEAQIDTIKPEIIILCGSTATKVFKITETMKTVHGNCFKQKGVKLFPIYHPRASISNSIKLQDLKKIAKVYANL